MVEINNQRKAFLDNLSWWSEERERKNRNHGYDVIVGGELFASDSRSPSQTCHAKPKTRSTGAGRYQLLSRWWDAYASSSTKNSRKSQDAVALQQIKERGALPMIDRGDIRQAIDRCSNIWASLGAGYGQFRHKADGLILR